MFRELRRKKQALSHKENIEILQRNTAGVLSLIGDEGYPYGVPMSYVLIGDTIYFHCAKKGHKMDALENSDKAAFCVIDQDRIMPEELNTYYRSVIAFGRVKRILEEKKMKEILIALSKRYGPDLSMERIQEELRKDFEPVAILAFEIEHLSGKASKDLMPGTKE